VSSEHPATVDVSPPGSGGESSPRASGWGRVDAFLRGRIGYVLSVGVVLLLTWPIRVVELELNDDYSFKVGLRLGAELGLQHGRDIVYTYGPLGLLNVPALITSAAFLWAVLVAVAVNLALVALVVGLLRRQFSPLVAVGIAFVVLSVATIDQATQVLDVVVVLWCIILLTTPESKYRSIEVAVVGAMSGVAMVIKFDAITLLLLALYATAVSAWEHVDVRTAVRRSALLVGAFLLAVVFSLIVTGQSIGTVDDWLRMSIETTTGYNAAMGIEVGATRNWAMEYLFAAVIAVVYLWWTIRSKSLDGRARGALTIFLAVVLFLEFKYGFVRHDDGHALKFFIAMALVPLALMPVWGRWRALSAIAFVLVVTTVFVYDSGTHQFDLVERAHDLSFLTKMVVSPARRDAFIDKSQRELREFYAVPRRMREEIGDKGVHMDPAAAGVAFAYPSLHWDPLPAFQSFVAYTPALDDLNADRLIGKDRPEYVLREPRATLDQRLRRFESPRTTYELFCHYRLVDESAHWQLLKAASSQCGEPELIDSQAARFGQEVAVPEVDDAIVVARFSGIADSIFDRARTLAWKPREIYFVIGGQSYRFLPLNQGQYHVMSVPDCAPVPDDAQGRQISDFRVVDEKAIPRVDDRANTYRVEFFAVPYECP